ncbi:MAG: transposase family protein [Cylindrospermopsis raciborskii]|uniref:transposase family protein n=1 Tax=Cylindrospermopsis raciborskii TaxID=77022 RepID=UPI003D1467F9
MRDNNQEDKSGDINVKLRQDPQSGSTATSKEFVNVHLSHKKPKGKELTQQQKQENRELSRQRVLCEHAHAGIKRYNSVCCVYRNRVPDFDNHLMLVA